MLTWPFCKQVIPTPQFSLAFSRIGCPKTVLSELRRCEGYATPRCDTRQNSERQGQTKRPPRCRAQVAGDPSAGAQGERTASARMRQASLRRSLLSHIRSAPSERPRHPGSHSTCKAGVLWRAESARVKGRPGSNAKIAFHGALSSRRRRSTAVAGERSPCSMFRSFWRCLPAATLPVIPKRRPSFLCGNNVLTLQRHAATVV